MTRQGRLGGGLRRVLFARLSAGNFFPAHPFNKGS